MSTFGYGYSIKQAATSGYTLLTGEAAFVTYAGASGGTGAQGTASFPPATVYYGPGETIAASIVAGHNLGSGAPVMAFAHGIVFKNT
jgi:hypothetical protein